VMFNKWGRSVRESLTFPRSLFLPSLPPHGIAASDFTRRL
jgi:hypothetical protein